VSLRVAGVVTSEGRVLLARHEKGGESYWVLPGGSVEPGETLAGALVREMREEAGIESEVGEFLFINDGYRPQEETVALYFAVEPKGEPGGADLSGEAVLREVRWFTPEELSDLDLRPRVRDELLAYFETGQVRTRYLGRR